MDLRVRVVQAVDRGMTMAEASRTFGVGYNTIRRYLALRDETGALSPKPRRSGGAAAIGPELLPSFVAQLEAHSDYTLLEHAKLWEEAHGVRLHPSTISRYIARVGWTLKKRPSTRQSGTRRRGGGGAPGPKG